MKEKSAKSLGDARFRIFLKEISDDNISDDNISEFSGTEGATIVYDGELDVTTNEYLNLILIKVLQMMIQSQPVTVLTLSMAVQVKTLLLLTEQVQKLYMAEPALEQILQLIHSVCKQDLLLSKMLQPLTH